MIDRRRFALTLAGLYGSQVVPVLAQGTQPYKIGVTFPLTGPVASSSQLYIAGAQIAVDKINGAGGVAGHLLQLVIEDSQGTPQGGITAMRKLIDADRVQAILTIYTNVVNAQIPLAEQAKVPLLCTIETAALRGKSPYAFQHAAVTENKTQLFERYWRKTGAKKIYSFVVNNAAGPYFGALAKSAATSTGADYREVSFNDGETDYRGLIARCKEFAPDSIFLAELGGLSGSQIVRQLREGGVEALVIMPGIFFDEPGWRSGVGSYIDTIIMSGVTFDPKAGQSFVNAYRSKSGNDPSYIAGEVYECVLMYAAAMAHAPYNGEAIRDALASLKGIPSVFGGTISMDSTNYSVLTNESLWRVHDGKLVRVPV